MHEAQQIAIIGAGFAGLTAAYRLQQMGYKVAVFEARPRVGGRVQSILLENFDGDYSVGELGAQNICDGGDAANLIALVKELKLPLIKDFIEFKGAFYDGHNIHESKIVFPVTKLSEEEYFAQLETFAKTCHSLEQVLDHIYPEQSIQKRILTYMLTAYEGLPPSALSAQPHNLRTLKYMLAGALSQAHTNSEALERITLKGGNVTLAVKLAEKIADRLHLNKALQKVTPLNNNTLLLTFADKTIFKCHKLILALPCSVYKTIAFEEHIIESARLKLMQAVGYSVASKMIVPVTNISPEKKWLITDHLGLFFNGDKKLLNAYYINNQQCILDSLELQKIYQVMSSVYPEAIFNSTVPRVAWDLNHIKSPFPVVKSWIKDPYAQGAFSSYNVELQDIIDQKVWYKNILVKKLFAPIQDWLFFAGEHTTILDEIGTMEAAVESGERVAKQVQTTLQTSSSLCAN